MRITGPREIIMNILAEAGEHLTATDIYLRAHAENPGIGLTTVYRTLEIFVQMGIVNKLDFGEGKARYQLVEENENVAHHHLVCTRCKNIIDYSDFIDSELDFIRETREKLSSKYNFSINGHAINFYGLCEKCRNQFK